MPVQRLEPSSSVAAEFSGTSVVGAATAHAALSDASDATYCQYQVSSTEPTKWYRGDLADLPGGAGVVLGVVINVRAAFSTGDGELWSGEYPNARLTSVLTGTITDYATASLTLWPDPATVNGLTYMAGVDWRTVNGAVLRIYKMNFDVDFNYIISSGAVSMIFQWLGPLVAVGLHEMPRLSRELWRRGRCRFRPDELVPAWRALLEHQHRRYFAL